MVRNLLPILHEDLVLFAMVDGREVGVTLVLQNLAEAFQRWGVSAIRGSHCSCGGVWGASAGSGSRSSPSSRSTWDSGWKG